MSRKHVFFSRLLSSVILWTLALWVIFAGNEPGFLALIGGLGMLGLWEYYGMLDAAELPNFKMVGMACGLVIYAGTFAFASRGSHGGGDSSFSTGLYDFETATLAFCMLAIFVRQLCQTAREPVPITTMAYTAFGLLYVPYLFSFVFKITYLPPRDAVTGLTIGQFYVLYLCVVTKFSDMGAYVTGSLIGKHPLIPHISPNKTWEGFFGALVFSTGGSFAVRALLPHALGALTSRDTLILGVGLGVAAILGDLAESIIKRSTGVKDSGHMLPGIGGTLDLLDSVLVTAPILFFYLRFAVGMK